MFSHIMLGSNDVERSKRFYDKVLGRLGASEGQLSQSPVGGMRVSYQHGGSNFVITEPINGERATFANGGTLGFQCNSPEQVLQFHEAAVTNGGTTAEDPPGERNGPWGPIHLAYVRDPDGHKLCAVYRPS